MKLNSVFLFITLGLSACSSNITNTSVNITNTPAPKPTHSSEMLNLINQARSQARTCGNEHFHAAAPLRWNVALERSAQKHAQDMADKNYFAHNSRDGRSPFERMTAEGYQFSTAAENIANGQQSAQNVMKSWLRSPGHCANIMNPNMREVGMAVAYNSGAYVMTPRIYWVQNFGAR